MASAVEQLTNNYETSSPVNFNDYYNAWGVDNYGSKWKNSDPNSLESKVSNFFYGDVSSAKQAYENYLAGYEYHRNALASAKANEETYAREDSQVQRLLDDYRKAGLNPFALLAGGNLSSGVVSSQAQYGTYKRSKINSNEKDDNKMMSSAIKVMALMILKSVL